jgi:ABC-type sugar transport system permease subunit
MGRDLQSQSLANASFNQKLQQRLQSEPRRQAPLMLEVSGNFSSFFAGKDRPKKASELKEEEDRKKAEADAQKPADEAAKDPEVGPPMPKQEKDDAAVAAAPKDPEPILAASKKGRIVAFADSDFVRDDFTRGVYRQQGGPYSIFGAAFFPMLIDWISQDSDLIALQSRLPSDRKIALLGDQVDQAADRRDTEQKLRATRTTLVTANVAGPCIVVLALGLAVLLFRRAQKRRFLESLGN